jgi:hypothetical protein
MQQQQQQPSSQLTQKQLQNKPQVAVITAAGPIMQAAGGSPGASAEGMVESHKLVRVLRAMRENPQVRNCNGSSRALILYVRWGFWICVVFGMAWWEEL